MLKKRFSLLFRQCSIGLFLLVFLFSSCSKEKEAFLTDKVDKQTETSKKVFSGFKKQTNSPSKNNGENVFTGVTITDLRNNSLLVEMTAWPPGYTPLMSGVWNYSSMTLFLNTSTYKFVEAYEFSNSTDRANASGDCPWFWDSNVTEGSPCGPSGSDCGVDESDLTIICCN